MSQFFSQYFDVNFMIDHFDTVFKAFTTMTLELFFVGGVLSLIWGLILSLLRQVPGRAGAPIRFLAVAYIDVFRGIPMLLVILLIYGGFGALSSSNATPGPLPAFIADPHWLGKPAAFWYGVMAITITYGAYMAEVYRAGIESVPRGQMEAARSLGMSHAQAMRYVIVPQAVRTVIPPLLNDLVALMKDTSLVSIISLPEAVQVAFDIQSKTFNSSALTLAAFLYLIVTLPMARLVDWLIHRQQRRTQRGPAAGGGDEGEPEQVAGQPLGTGAAAGV
jgi:polar amino acid transport system permease protein